MAGARGNGAVGARGGRRRWCWGVVHRALLPGWPWLGADAAVTRAPSLGASSRAAPWRILRTCMTPVRRPLNFASKTGEQMKLETGDSQAALTEAEQIDAIVAQAEGWKGLALTRLRDCIRRADPGIQEEVKWRKPSRPMGVPVWSRDGIVCVADVLKSAVRLTFPKGAAVDDPSGIFNTRLDSRTVRAVDFREGDEVNEAALAALVRDAVRLNTSSRGRQ